MRTNCRFCYKDAGDANYHRACAKKFFRTAEVPALVLDEPAMDPFYHQHQE